MIIDTNALAALVCRDARLTELLSQSSQLAVTLISLGEYECGISGSTNQPALRAWLEAFTARADILSVNRQTVSLYAEIRHELKSAGTPIPANDVWIAALARQYRQPIVSRDAHFDQVAGLQRLTW